MELQRYAEVVGVPNEVILLLGLLNARDIDITGVIAITTHFRDEATETQSWGLARKNLAVELPLLITLLSVRWIVPRPLGCGAGQSAELRESRPLPKAARPAQDRRSTFWPVTSVQPKPSRGEGCAVLSACMVL